MFNGICILIYTITLIWMIIFVILLFHLFLE